MSRLKAAHEAIYEYVKQRGSLRPPERLKAVLVPRDRYKSKLERVYASHLAFRQQIGEILDWRYEALVFPIDADSVYTPDFIVTLKTGKPECHEVKGYHKNIRESIRRFKDAKALYDGFIWRWFERDERRGWIEKHL